MADPPLSTAPQSGLGASGVRCLERMRRCTGHSGALCAAFQGSAVERDPDDESQPVCLNGRSFYGSPWRACNMIRLWPGCDPDFWLPFGAYFTGQAKRSTSKTPLHFGQRSVRPPIIFVINTSFPSNMQTEQYGSPAGLPSPPSG